MVMKGSLKKPGVLTVPAGELKAKCLHLIDEVHDEALDVIVTKRGKPMARLVPIEPEEKPFRSVIGRSPNVKIVGDIMKPLYWPDPVEKWNRVNGVRKEKKRK